MADINILDFVEESLKEADAFENHPLKTYSLEEQLLYLNVLSLVMFVDQTVTMEEKTYLSILIKSFSLDPAVLDSLIEFAEQPDKQIFQAFIQFFRRKPIAQLFLFDAYMLASSSQPVSDDARLLINQLADGLEILKGTQQDIFDMFCHIKNRNWQESALYFSSHLLNPKHFQHLLAYYEVDFDDLMNETTTIRQNRLIQILKKRMPNVITGDNIKPILDHEIIIPFLQAELDRGNAIIVYDILTLHDDENKKINIKSIGIGWNKESISLYSVKNKEINNRIIIRAFVEQLCTNTSMVEAIEVLYGRDIVRMKVENYNITSISSDVSVEELDINVYLINEDLWIFRTETGLHKASSEKLFKNQWYIVQGSVFSSTNYRGTSYRICEQIECSWDEIFCQGLKVQ